MEGKHAREMTLGVWIGSRVFSGLYKKGNILIHGQRPKYIYLHERLFNVQTVCGS